jgi:hypothetical protein
LIANQLHLTYANETELTCGSSCGAAIRFDITSVTHNCDTIDMKGASLTEVVTSDFGCLPPGPILTGSSVVGPGNSLAGTTDTYILCAAAAAYRNGTCNET